MAVGGEDALRKTSSLLISVQDLLTLQGVEKQRVEFKKAWHGRKQGGTYWQILHTICAFANDFYNDNGGYIIIGVEEEQVDCDENKTRQAKLPPFGIVPLALDRIQKEVLGACRGDIKPSYTPVVSPEIVQEKHVLVIWVRASEIGPLQCKESDKGGPCYYIRKGPETKKATAEEVAQLAQQHSKTPFDDRMAICSDGRPVALKDIDLNLVKLFLDSVRSELVNQKCEPEELFEKMDLVTRYGDRRVMGRLQPVFVPRYFSLLFFNESPCHFLRGAKIEIGRYNRDDDVIEETQLSGPIDKQIGECLSYILDHTREEVSHACVTYPQRALREAVVNAVYHRGYEAEYCEPTKVHMRPDCIEIISYPGPHPSLKLEHFKEGKKRPSVPARNRRIGNHLKQLKLAEARYTGVNTIFKTMKRNENAPPNFEFDSCYFQVTLPGHPKYITSTLLSDAENLVAKGEKEEAIALLLEFLENHPDMYSKVLFFKILELHDGDENHPNIQKHVSSFLRANIVEVELLVERLPLIKQLRQWTIKKPLDVDTGVQLVKQLVNKGATLEELKAVVQNAVSLCRTKGSDGTPNLENLQNGHKLLEAMGSTILQSDGYLAFEYACCKYSIFVVSVKNKIGKPRNLSTYLLHGQEYITKAMQLTDRESKSYLAKQYRQLGLIKFRLLSLKKATVSDVLECYSKARELNPAIKINRFCVPEEGRWMYRSPILDRKFKDAGQD